MKLTIDISHNTGRLQPIIHQAIVEAARRPSAWTIQFIDRKEKGPADETQTESAT